MNTDSVSDRIPEYLVTESSLCARVRHKSSTCSACMDVCREEAVSITSAGGRVVIDNTRCSGCGKCFTVCPNRVFRQKSIEREQVLENMFRQINTGGGLRIACCECPHSDAVTLCSLAYADRYLIMRAVRAGAKSVTLFTGRCSECSKDCVAAAEKETGICRMIIDEAGLNVPVEIKHFNKAENKILKSPLKTERGGFSVFMKMGAKKRPAPFFESGHRLKKTVLSSENGSYERTLTSDIRIIGGESLVDAMRAKGILRSVNINGSKCVLCGVCARICPFGVFTIVTDKVRGRVEVTDITVDMDACTGCGVCQLSCIPKAINII